VYGDEFAEPRVQDTPGSEVGRMSELLSRPVVPVADDEDARVTAQALVPHLAGTAEILVVYVIEKAGGAMDKASVEQREIAAEAAFDAFREVLDGAAVPTDVTVTIRYDTDVVRGVFETAAEHDASAVAFVPRGGGTLVSLLTGRRTDRLVTENELPVVSLPAPEA
jgi:hypothetical protein